MKDRTYYHKACRPCINYSHPYLIRETVVSPLVTVTTKSFANYTGLTDAHIETFVMSSDSRVRSRHIIHEPRRVLAAVQAHRQLVAGARTLLGIPPEVQEVATLGDSVQASPTTEAT